MRLLRTWWVGVGTAMGLCVTAAVAVGQAPTPTYPECTKKPTPQETEGAKGAHNAASQFYDRAEYEKAISYWNDAYKFDCTANGLLLNIANAHEKVGDRAATIATLEAYLKRTGPNATLELKVKNLKAQLASQTPSPSVSAAPTVAPSVAPVATSTPTRPPEGPRPHGITPWIVVGGGGALAIVGAILMPVGYSAISTAEGLCPVRATCNDANAASQGNSGRTQVGVGWGMFTVGLAAAGGGLAWQLLFNKPQAMSAQPKSGQKSGQGSGMWVTPVAAPGAGGVSFGGRF